MHVDPSDPAARYAPTIEIPLRDRDGVVKAVALIDAADWEQATHRWSDGGSGYAKRSVRRNGERWSLHLHREVMGLGSFDGREVDHINGDRLDCRRVNLRVVDRKANTQNRPPVAGSTSRYRGVWWNTQCRKWQVEVKVNGKRHYLGVYSGEDEAGAVAEAFRAKHVPYSVPERAARAA